jgi:peptide-methionine (R)-S-oxide reductase
MQKLLTILFILSAFIADSQTISSEMQKKEKLNKTEDQWKQELTDEEYNILRNCGTEPPFTGKYYKHDEKGTYHCAACGAKLFSSETKYESGSGWPSFYDAIDKKAIKELPDNSLGMRRIEIKCAKCNGHLGHVFPDGPNPSGLRYCVNSVSLDFKGEENSKEK